MPDENPDAATAVGAFLDAAGLKPSIEELAILVEAYPAHRAAMDALYAIPEVRYEAPGLIFDVTPVFADWAS